jgi:hypothetical protein
MNNARSEDVGRGISSGQGLANLHWGTDMNIHGLDRQNLVVLLLYIDLLSDFIQELLGLVDLLLLLRSRQDAVLDDAAEVGVKITHEVIGDFLLLEHLHDGFDSLLHLL